MVGARTRSRARSNWITWRRLANEMQSGVRRLSIRLWRTQLPQRWVAARTCEHCIVPHIDCEVLNGAEMAAGEDGELHSMSIRAEQGRSVLHPHWRFNKARHVQAQVVLTMSSSLPLRRLLSAIVRTKLVSLRHSYGPHVRLDSARSTVHIHYSPQHSQASGISIRGLRYLLPARDDAIVS